MSIEQAREDGAMGNMPQILDLERLRAIAEDRRQEFAKAQPFAHVVIDDFLTPDAIRGVLEEFPTSPDAWRYLHHVNEKKKILPVASSMGPVTQAVIRALHSKEMVSILENLSGIPRLLPDPRLEGGGLAEMAPGAFLNIHRDYQSHPIFRTWSRQLNLILFLNENWQSEFHGELELWSADVRQCLRRVEPIANRCVLFHTGPTSFHGVPTPVACPPGDSRKSLALYYFRDEHVPRPIASTLYMPRPGDSAIRRAMIRLDTALVRLYTAVKRYTPIGDDLASRILKRF